MISTAERNALRRLADRYGIQRSYLSMGKKRVTASADAARAVLIALGADLGAADPHTILKREEERYWQRLLEPVVVAWNGELRAVALRLPATDAHGTVELAIRLENNGGVIEAAVRAGQRSVVREATVGSARFVECTFGIPERLPVGYHELNIRAGRSSAQSLILSAPVRCHTGHTRGWGVFAPLYATRSRADKPIGDLSELEQLLTWVAGLGGNVIATLPISAAFLDTPFDPSPYSPASRLFWNELFVDLERLLGSTDCVPARNRAHTAEWQHAMRSAASGQYVDYRTIAQHKRHVLEALADCFFREQRHHGDDFSEFLALYPDAEAFARFRAACERHGSGWMAWPARMQAGEIQPQDFDDDVARYHLYAQFAMHRQLKALAGHARGRQASLYLDMPLGVHPESFDVWRARELFVTGVSAGAPPDAFFTRGQNWGFPPLNPRTLREQRYSYWRRVLQTQMRYAGMLRIDHVMALHRLFFVPSGFEAREGVYVRYPEEELYAVLTIESQRHGSSVVGEDLGTVPAEVRRSMKRHAVKRMFVVQFEAQAAEPPISTVPAAAVASLNTHDMPPFAAYWNALDADLRHELGLLDDAAVQAERAQRRKLTHALVAHLRKAGVTKDGTLDTGSALHALLEWLARSPADITLVNLEDLWLEEQPQNVPGTLHEKPNWRRRMRYTLGEIMDNQELAILLGRINAARQQDLRQR